MLIQKQIKPEAVTFRAKNVFMEIALQSLVNSFFVLKVSLPIQSFTGISAITQGGLFQTLFIPFIHIATIQLGQV